ncbi:hypothetical protein IWW50_003819 [Coemansia erecta]|nr:hypothetical protein IWW50_003819 [Coemansia erecta]
MKVTAIASVFALAAVTQAAPTLHTVTKYVEPATVTVYQVADAGVASSSARFFGGHHFSWPFKPHHTHGAPSAAEESSSADEATADGDVSSDEATADQDVSSDNLSTADESDVTEPEASASDAESSSASDSDSGSGSGSGSSSWVTEMVCAINKVRASHGASPLGISEELNSIAQKHSDYQNSINQMTHDDPSGGVGERLAALGVSWMSAAENVAAGMTSAEQAQKALEASPGHLENMVDPSMTFVGVGRTSNYYTQDFYGNGSGTRASNIPQCS